MLERHRRELITLLIFALVAGASYLSAQEGGTRSTVVGEVIDLASYAATGAHGAETAEAGQFRAEKGFPVGILESETKTVYVAVYRDPAPASALETANEKLGPLMGKEVVVQGQVFRRDGLNVVEIALVAEI